MQRGCDGTLQFCGHEAWSFMGELLEYDHVAGRLRWREKCAVRPFLPREMVRVMRRGRVAGQFCARDGYILSSGGSRRKALPFVWEQATGKKHPCVMTIEPGETAFQVDKLCIIPMGRALPPVDRAAGYTVVSYSWEWKRYTVVRVDGDYNKEVLSYHDDIDAALSAVKSDEVSFL